MTAESTDNLYLKYGLFCKQRISEVVTTSTQVARNRHSNRARPCGRGFQPSGQKSLTGWSLISTLVLLVL